MEHLKPILDPEQILNEFCAVNPQVTRLHVAENVLLLDPLKTAFSRNCNIELEDIKYQSSHGSEQIRRLAASFLSKTFGLDPALGHGHVSLFAGTRCALEMAARGRGAVGQDYQVLLPTPAWQGFDWIYSGRLSGTIEPVPVPVDSWTLTRDAVERAWQKGGRKARALVLTNPHNPLGINYSPDLLREIFEWVLAKTKMDIVSDEIYAHCQRTPIHRSGFRSALTFDLAKKHPDRFHVAWGFAKDFGLSGYRVGVLASRDEALHKKVAADSALAGFSPMTSSNAWFLRKLLTGGVAEAMMTSLSNLLNRRFQVTHEALDTAEIPYFKGAKASLFAWLDLRRWLERPFPTFPTEPGDERLERFEILDGLGIQEREHLLMRYLQERALVQLLPGSTLGAPELGFFRLCFTAVNQNEVLDAIRRIGLALAAIPTKPS